MVALTTTEVVPAFVQVAVTEEWILGVAISAVTNAPPKLLLQYCMLDARINT